MGPLFLSLSLLAAPAMAPDAGPGLVEDPLLPGRPAVLRGHTDGIQAIAFSPSGDRLVSVGRDRTLVAWDVARGTRLSSMALPGQPSAVAFSADGRRVAIGSVELQAFVVDLDAGAVTQSYAHPDVAIDVAFSPDGTRLGVAGGSDTGAVYALTSVERQTAFQGRAIRWLPDGSTFVTAVGSGPVTLVDAAKGAVRKTLAPSIPRARLTSTPDARVLAASSALSPQVHLLTASGQAVATVTQPAPPPVDGEKRPAGRVTALALSVDGKRLLTASTDRALRLWSIADQKVLASWPIDNVSAVAVSPDGRWVVAADGALLKWWKAP